MVSYFWVLPMGMARKLLPESVQEKIEAELRVESSAEVELPDGVDSVPADVTVLIVEGIDIGHRD